MFEALSDRFDGIFGRLRGRGRLGEADVDEVLSEIRVALLEADVNFRVVGAFVDRVRERCVGEELSQSLTPAQLVIKAVNEELTRTLGGDSLQVTYASKPPTVVLIAGLQGSGKTTACAKLARWFKRQGRNPLLVGADLQRPAAVEQLRVLGDQVDVPVFSEATDPVKVAKRGLREAGRLGRDVLVCDTAGRLGIDADARVGDHVHRREALDLELLLQAVPRLLELLEQPLGTLDPDLRSSDRTQISLLAQHLPVLADLQQVAVGPLTERSIDLSSEVLVLALPRPVGAQSGQTCVPALPKELLGQVTACDALGDLLDELGAVPHRCFPR